MIGLGESQWGYPMSDVDLKKLDSKSYNSEPLSRTHFYSIELHFNLDGLDFRISP